MMIQLDKLLPAPADAGWRGRRWQHAYAADGDPDGHDWATAISTAAPSSVPSTVGPSASCAVGHTPDYHHDEDIEALAADMDELEEALESVDLEELRDDELEQMAMEAQKLGHKVRRYSGKPDYRSARQAPSQGKVNRGWKMQVTDHEPQGRLEANPGQDAAPEGQDQVPCVWPDRSLVK